MSMKVKRKQLVATLVAVAALTSLVVLGYSNRFLLRFALDEPWQSESRRAYAVLTTRFGQEIRNGEIAGEVTWSREAYRPTWVGKLDDPRAIDCNLNVRFPRIDEATEEGRYFRSDRVIVVGPKINSQTTRAFVATVYEGGAIDFLEILTSDRIAEIFDPGNEQSVVDAFAKGIPFSRDDEGRVFRSAIEGRNTLATTTECKGWSFTVFEFDAEKWRLSDG